MLKHTIIAATTLAVLSACAKHDPGCEPAAEGANVTVSFVSEPNTTRAFFDASSTEA